MSIAFLSQKHRQGVEVTQSIIQKILDENNQLIQCIVDYQNRGKSSQCTQYQQILHRNLVYLATIADSAQSSQSTPANQSALVGGGLQAQDGLVGVGHMIDSGPFTGSLGGQQQQQLPPHLPPAPRDPLGQSVASAHHVARQPMGMQQGNAGPFPGPPHLLGRPPPPSLLPPTVGPPPPRGPDGRRSPPNGAGNHTGRNR
ncbi:SS18-like protein 2 [Lampetra fluviatilis]